MSNCLITIVTISKNNFQGLYKTLESVKEQDYEAIEHLVIDGDSSDGTKELLQSYSHSKMYIYFSEPDNGISSAFNKGLDKSNGNLIYFLNSGDVFVSKKVISEVISSYINNGWRCAEGGVISSSYAGDEVLYIPPKLPSRFLKYLMFLPHQGFFCETDIHKPYRYDESIKTSMDYDLFIRMLKDIEIFYLPIVVAKCEPGGVSSQSKLRVAEHSQIRMKYADTLGSKLIVSIINRLIRFKDSLKITSPFAKKQRI